jgi:hypothetical protein
LAEPLPFYLSRLSIEIDGESKKNSGLEKLRKNDYYIESKIGFSEV